MTSSPLYKDQNAPIADRVRDLISIMTLEEKAAQLQCMWERKVEFQDDEGEFSPEKARTALANGIGQISRISDYRGYPRFETKPFRTVENTVGLVNDIQRFLVEETRLGIPVMFHDEIVHGLLAGEATVFPNPMALGSTWDVDLVEEVFAAVASEARRRGTTVALGPVVDLLRDPRFGRADEMFGEDGHHVAAMGIAAARGLQGESRPLGADKLFVTLKHLLHGTPVGGLNISPAEMSERAMREHFLVPFSKIVKALDIAALMPSYNEVHGVPSHANKELLQKTGRELLGFKGGYFSDYFGIQNLEDVHRVVADRAEAAALAMNVGVTTDMPEGNAYVHLPQLVREGRVTQDQLDAAVSLVLSMKFEAGLFENPYISLEAATDADAYRHAVETAKRSAERGLVLLKNDGILPLSLDREINIAVVGPNSKEALFGGYSGDNSQAVGILAGLKEIVSDKIRLEQADGVWITGPDDNNQHRPHSKGAAVTPEDNAARIREAVAIAERSDVIILCVGDVPAVTREAVDYNLPGDRTGLGLWGQQDDLVEAMVATGKPIVAVLSNGRPLAITRLAESANALIEAWYLGQETGHAIASAMFGKTNPGGKLSVSIPRSVGELPVTYNRHPSVDWNQYLEGQRQPLFPFGYGLSYTTFSISEPRLAKERISLGEGAWVEVQVTNTGSRVGDEVIQLYIRDEISSVPRSVLELRKFERLTLQPGETRLVGFDLTSDDLAFWDIDMQWSVEPGTFVVSVGNSSINLKSTKLTVVRTEKADKA